MEKVNAPELEFQSKAKKLRGEALIVHHLNGIRLAIKEQVKWTAAIDSDLQVGLAAIALAASTPEDNSAQVKEFTERIKTQVGALKSAAQQSKGE